MDSSKPYKCDKCEKSFKFDINMKKHITKDHEGGELPFKCDMCEKAFLYETKLNTHKMYVHERNIN